MIRAMLKLGHLVLENPAQTVTSFDDHLRTLIADMVETMYAAEGIGLAAPQIGVSRRIATFYGLAQSFRCCEILADQFAAEKGML